MNFKGIEICCPHCRGELEQAQDAALACRGCGREFPVLLGIPDLRIFPDPYIGLEDDRAKAARLGERFDEFNFEGFVDFYYSITPAVPPQHVQIYKRGLMAAPGRAADWLASWEAAAGNKNGQALLDVGCGTAPLLLAARHYATRVGVDIAFRWLILAKKRLSETGLDLPLVCACGEALPFRSECFDRVIADSTIEHFRDQRKGLDEMHRVLRPGGWLFLATPNRFSLGPDPHTGVWAGSWLPQSWTAAIMRRSGGIPPMRNLLHIFSLRRLLTRAGFEWIRVSLPGVPARQRAHFSSLMRLVIGVYDLFRRIPVARHALYLVGPLLQAAVRRKE